MTNPRCTLKNESGFGLMEVLVSLGVLMVVVLAANSVAVHARNSYWFEQRRMKAIELAESLTEELLLRAKTDAVLQEGTHRVYYDQLGRLASVPEKFEAVWTITDQKPMTDIFEINVEVKWVESGAPRSISLLTARAFNP